MAEDAEPGPIDQILSLAHEIIEECPSCARKATRIVMWANQIRERRPDRAELATIVGVQSAGLLPDARMRALVDHLCAVVRYAE
jgi:hypothetical protein